MFEQHTYGAGLITVLYIRLAGDAIQRRKGMKRATHNGGYTSIIESGYSGYYLLDSL